ncbi:MAG: hypothetical protein HXY35_00370 [Chloroflexi bacterium]|nr:hypothetical protein [Chloroflexota bacterium]
MSKLSTRVLLSVLISLGVIVGIYTTVLGASPWGNRAGTHLVSGAKVNLDHFRSTEVQRGSFDAQENLFQNGPAVGGHGCESESRLDSSDL